MVCAFIIQTMDSKDSVLLYYRTFSSLSGELIMIDDSATSRIVDLTIPLYQTNIEKKDFLKFIANKVNMLYALKHKQSLVSVSQDKDTVIKGVFKERNWKKNQCEPLIVAWQSVRDLGFSIVCKRDENYNQAQNILEIIVSRLDKYLQLLSNPVVALKSIESVSLIVNKFLPSGQLLFLNSAVVESFNNQLEKDLYSK